MFKKQFVFFLFLALIHPLMGQELNCTVEINADQITRTNKQIFGTLKTALTEFVNQQKWTGVAYNKNEKVSCGMTFIITAQTGNSFTGTLQVNAVRPVFGTSYSSPIFNFKDTNISFQYTEFEPLNFNPNAYDSNLISLMAFYAYTILGIDADTFAFKGGETYFQKAMDVANLAQQSNDQGWTLKRNQANRFSLLDQILSTAHEEYRTTLYTYHREGLDVFSQKESEAKEAMGQSIFTIEKLFNKNRNSFLVRTFFDAKADEIVNVFQSGKEQNKREVLASLRRISPVNLTKWQKID
jgi:hypothetical protein